MKTLNEIKDIINTQKKFLNEKYGAISIKIFGSFNRSEQSEESDLDILVEFRSAISLLKIVSLQNYLSDITGMRVDVVQKDNIHSDLKEEILQEAILL